MSGISVEALQELCFGKDTDEKPVHVNNILKFAVMKKDRSFSAIGGPSHVSLDGDLQVDDFSLIQTAIRQATYEFVLLFIHPIFVFIIGFNCSLWTIKHSFSCRHVKHLTQLDLHNCHHWNRFLEVHTFYFNFLNTFVLSFYLFA